MSLNCVLDLVAKSLVVLAVTVAVAGFAHIGYEYRQRPVCVRSHVEAVPVRTWVRGLGLISVLGTQSFCDEWRKR